MAVSLIFFYDRCKIHTDAVFVKQGYSLGFMSEVPSRFMRKTVCRLRLSEVSRQ